MTALPLVALTASRVPGPDATDTTVIGFNGSVGLGKDGASADPSGLKAQMDRVEAEGAEALDLHDLRLAFYGFQRAHYHQGGGWGDHDPLMDRMRAIAGVIRERVAAPRLGVWRGDLTTLDVDAVVNAANERMLGGGGVDQAIHRAAGPDLLAACRAVQEVRPGVRCPTGEARVTPGFALPASHVIHTVGPVWRGGDSGEDDHLASAYRNSLRLAAEHGADSVAFPAISTGVFGFPADRAARIAVETVRKWHAEHPSPAAVVLVAFDENAEATLRDALAD